MVGVLQMNLTPVEQYYAEMLRILDMRKHPRKQETDEVNRNSVKTESFFLRR